MDHIMPDPAKIGGYNKIEIPPISINPGKANAINVAEKVIRMAVNVAPNRIFISQKRIRQLANNLIEKGIICHEPACLELKMKNGSIQFNLTYWIYNGYRGDMRPLTDIQLLDRILVNIEREENEITREEATPEESKKIIQKLLMEFRPESIELSTSFSSSFSFSRSCLRLVIEAVFTEFIEVFYNDFSEVWSGKRSSLIK